jgi:hypothetical protein
MDLYNESRSLVYSGTLARRVKSEMGSTWVDLHVALLDNHRQFSPLTARTITEAFTVLLTKEEQQNGVTKYRLTSRVRTDVW